MQLVRISPSGRCYGLIWADEFSSFPEAFDTRSTEFVETALSVLGPVLEVPFVDSSVGHFQSAEAVYLVVEEISFVLDAVGPFEYTFSLPHTIHPASFVGVSVGPNVGSL